MKKTINISLSQTAFILEEDAYAKLDQYLKSINAHFSNTEGKDELIADIENRIAEQLSDTKKSIITLAEVEHVIASMGQVEDFDSNESSSAHQSTAHTSGSTGSDQAYTYRPFESGKKLYRDADDNIIAGVCSGLAIYFGVDVLWVRIFFVVLTLLTGFGILIYLMIWLFTPLAKTSAQKLEMSGSPVNIETLRENVKERFDEVKDKVEVVKKNHGGALRKILSLPFDILKAIFVFIKKVFGPLIRWISGLALTIFSGLGLLAASFFASLLLFGPQDKFTDFPIHEITTSGSIFTLILASYLAVIIPLVFIFALGLTILKKKKAMNGNLGFGLLGVWALAVIISGVSIFKTTVSYDEFARTNPMYMETTREIPLLQTGSTGTSTLATSTVSILNFTSVIVKGGTNIDIVQGSSTSLTAFGNEKSIERIAATIQEDGSLLITRSPHDSNNMCMFCTSYASRLTLTVPSLEIVKAQLGSRVDIETWTSDKPITIDFDTGSHGDMTITAPELYVKANHGSHLDLAGKVSTTTLSATLGSHIDAEHLESVFVKAEANNGAHIDTGTVWNLQASSTQGSHIRYENLGGDENVQEYTKSGGHVSSYNDEGDRERNN